jgi:hypothetical protein
MLVEERALPDEKEHRQPAEEIERQETLRDRRRSGARDARNGPIVRQGCLRTSPIITAGRPKVQAISAYSAMLTLVSLVVSVLATLVGQIVLGLSSFFGKGS